MALVGGGGAPNVAGSNPAGVGTSLNYIGDFVYGHSGAIEVSNSALTTLLEFNTGNELIECKINFISSFVETDPNDGSSTVFEMQMDGSTMLGIKLQGNPESMQTAYLADVIIPPNTRVTIKARNGNGGQKNTVVLAGRIY